MRIILRRLKTGDVIGTLPRYMRAQRYPKTECDIRLDIDVNVKIKYDKQNKSVGDRYAGCIWLLGLALLSQYNLGECWEIKIGRH